MASGKSVVQANATLDMWLGGVMPDVLATYYLMLFTASLDVIGVELTIRRAQ